MRNRLTTAQLAMYAAATGKPADSSTSKKKYRRTFSIASTGGGCSSVVPPGAHFARNEASDTRACDQPPEPACVGSMCRRIRTEDECASNEEEPSQDADRFPSSSGLPDDLNPSRPPRGITAMRARRRLVGNVTTALGALRQGHVFLNLRLGGHSSSSSSPRPSTMSLTISRALKAMAARGAV